MSNQKLKRNRGDRGELFIAGGVGSMDLYRLIAALSDPAAYPDVVDAVEVRQTHISVVFLAGRYAYKVKKPLALGFRP